jgi:20S proteasome subunit alpha 6
LPKVLYSYLESQLKTQRGEKRPYGVGLLIAGCDSTGPKLYRTCPSGNYYEYHCIAIGSRCQTANTFLENKLEQLDNATPDELIKIAIGAMKKAQDMEINAFNTAISIVGVDTDFKVFTSEELDKHFTGMEIA